VADALAGRRDNAFIVSKVYPHNAGRASAIAACERSLRRLRTDRIDLYLLHWRGQHPLRETVAAMHGLVADGHIGHWGVSNFDTDDMAELDAVVRAAGAGAPPCATDQVYLSASERGPEFRLLPWLRAHGQPLMAYSPIDQGAIGHDPTLTAIGAARGLTATQVALAWLCGLPGVLPIPKARSAAHLRQNLAAVEVVLTAAERAQIDAAFPPPTRATPLAMI
jgi:diketogulonate reductase-like aldo/keto reductase